MNTYPPLSGKRTVLLALAAALAGTASAQIVIFVEDFETQPLGSSTAGSSGSTVDDTSQFDIQNWGTFNNTDAQFVEIVNSKVSSGAQSARYNDQDLVSAPNVGFQHNFAALNASNPGAASYDASMPLVVSFDMLTDASSNNPTLFLSGSGGNGIRLMTRKWNGGLANKAGTVTTEIAAAGTIVAGTWYNYTLTINDLTTASDTYSLVVTDLGTNSPVFSDTGLGFENNVSDLSVINFQSTGNAGSGNVDFYVDNISITQVPEPSVLTLALGIGVLGLVSVRRRRA